MDEPKTDEELRSALEGDRYQIFECLATHGELSSSEIRDLAGIPDGSKHYQLSILDSWDLIEPVRRQYVGEYKTGIPATVYTLTEKGQALVEEWGICRGLLGWEITLVSKDSTRDRRDISK